MNTDRYPQQLCVGRQIVSNSLTAHQFLCDSFQLLWALSIFRAAYTDRYIPQLCVRRQIVSNSLNYTNFVWLVSTLVSLEHFPCSIYRQAYTTTLTLCSSSNRFQFSDRTMQTLGCVQYIQTGIHHNFVFVVKSFPILWLHCSSSNRFQFSDRTMQLVCVQYIQTGIHHNFVFVVKSFPILWLHCSSSNRFQFSDRTMQTLGCVQYIQTGIHHNFEEPMFSQDVSRELYDNESPTTTKEVMHTPYHIDAHTLVTQRTLVTDPPSTLSTDPKNIMPSYNSIFTFKFTFYNLLTCQTYLV